MYLVFNIVTFFHQKYLLLIKYIKGDFMLTYFSLVFALSIDSFFVALSYEANKIKIPFFSNLIISFICSFSLIFSLLLGNFITKFMPYYILKWFSFFVLFFIGIFKLFENYFKSFFTKKSKLCFKKLNFIIQIFIDYKNADYDNSRVLSKTEAFFLSLVLSIDSLSAGIAFQTDYSLFIPLLLFSLFINFMLILVSKIIKFFNIDFSFISGIIFIILAVFKI